jgi:hypothetical protein
VHREVAWWVWSLGSSTIKLVDDTPLARITAAAYRKNYALIRSLLDRSSTRVTSHSPSMTNQQYSMQCCLCAYAVNFWTWLDLSTNILVEANQPNFIPTKFSGYTVCVSSQVFSQFLPAQQTHSSDKGFSLSFNNSRCTYSFIQS